MTAGTAVIMWLGELITDRGVGNGMSLLIFTSIIAGVPGAALAASTRPSDGCWPSSVDRRCSALRGRRARRLRRAGAAPHPGAVRQAHDRPAACTAAPRPTSRSRSTRPASSRSSSPRRCSTCRAAVDHVCDNNAGLVTPGFSTLPRRRGDHPVYLLVYFALIVFFTYFYVAITFNPVEVADNMKKYGGFIPGIRAGRPTAEYLDYVLSRITCRRRALPRPDRASSRSCCSACSAQRPELPVRRHGDPDHGRRRPRDGEADREPAACSATTKASCASARSSCVGPPGRARARRPQFIAEHLRVPQISTGDIFRANVSEGTPLGPAGQGVHGRAATSSRTRSPSRWCATGWREPDARERLPARRLPAHRAAGRGARRHARASGDASSTSCSSSSSTTTRSSAGCPAGAPAARCGHIWHVDFDPPADRGRLRPRRRRALPARRRQGGDDRHRLEVYAEQTAPLVAFYADRGLLSASTPPARSTTSPSGRSTRCAASAAADGRSSHVSRRATA